MPYAELGDRWAAHLASMRSLSVIEVNQFSLSAPLVLPDGCSWQRFSVSFLAEDSGALIHRHWPSNWPLGAELRLVDKDALEWCMDSTEDTARARDVASALSCLPLKDAALELCLSGSHASVAAFSPLAPHITSIQLSRPTLMQTAEVTALLPRV